jgi:hypothetical protein
MDTNPARKPERITLEGRFCSLVPLDAEAHTSQLWEALHDPANDPLWLYMGDGPYRDPEVFR